VTSSDQFVTETALRECHLPIIKPPAVLVGITGQGRTRGTATILRVTATINQHIAFLKPRESRYLAEYLRAVLTTVYGFLRDESDGAGSTKGAITCEQLASLRLPRPPLAEQTDIVAGIESRSKTFDPVVANLHANLVRLKERRSALIHEAVTGQLPIRGTA
jgi:type I restriction enzyme S subunit